MLATALKKEIDLDFSIQEVKSSIERVCSNANTGFRILDKNDLFNTYRVSVAKSFFIGIMSITLNNNGAEKTRSSFEIHNTVGGEPDPAPLAFLQDYFLQLLSSALNDKWEDAENHLLAENENSNNNLTIILVTAIIIAIICIAGYVYNARTQ